MKVIIANNSAMFREMMSDILRENGDKVILKCANSDEAFATAGREKPDLVIMGENLSGAGEIATASELSKLGIPALVFGNPDALKSGGLIEKTGVKALPKPGMSQLQDNEYKRNLLTEFKDLARSGGRKFAGQFTKYSETPVNREQTRKDTEHIVIGSSTGGPKAVKEILDHLPGDFPVAMSIVQHMEEGHEENFAAWLNKTSPLSVRLAKDRDVPKPGEVIVGIQGKHLIAERNCFRYVDGEKVNFQKPAVDKLFESAANVYGKKLVGVLLTGMGNDGAAGCVEILNKGGLTIVQDQKTSTVFGMPKAAIEKNAASVVLPLGEIAEYLIRLVG